MKLHKALFANMLLAGSLLAVPAFAAESLDDATITGGTRTDVVAQGPGGPGGPGGDRPDWKRRPKMTDDQLIQIAALKDKFLSATAAQKTQLHSLHRQLKGALAKSEINRSEVLGIQSQINSVKADLSTKKLSNKLDFIAILSPEQKEQFRHRMLVSNAFGGHHGRGGRGGGGGGRGCGGGGGLHHGHGHHRGMGGPGGPGGPGGAPQVGFEQEQGPGPIAFDMPDAGFEAPDGPDEE